MAETDQNNQNMQPGAVIGPNGVQSTIPQQAPQAQPLQPVVSATIPDTTPPIEAQSQPSVNQVTGQPEQPQPLFMNDTQPSQVAEGSYAWTAAEFVAHHKTPQWFVAFAAVCFIIIAAVFFITKDVTAVLALIVGAVAVGIFAGRAPRDQQFQIDDEGFSIGQRRFSFAQFKSFSVIHEGALSSVQFLPLKRFAPYTTIYFGPNDEDQVLDRVEDALPYVEHAGDAIDRLLRRVRF